VGKAVGAVGDSSRQGADQNRDDDEEWWNADSGQRFDFMQYACNPQKPTLNIPLDLVRRSVASSWNGIRSG